MKVKAHILKRMKVDREKYNNYSFREHLNDPDFFEHYLCITCLLYNPADEMIYCGLTAYNNDLLYRFDPRTGQFQSCGYNKVADEYEVKIHRSLELDDDGTIYGATACLHDLDEYLNAPGGAIFKYGPSSGKIEKMGIPIPHEYIQTISLDKKRKIIYGITYPSSRVFRFDLHTQITKDLGLIGSQPERLAIDDEGKFWGTWWDSRKKKLNLFTYDPDKNKMEYLNFGIGSTPVVSPFYGKHYDNEIDCMISADDGCLYIGTELGMLFQLDPKSRKIECLGKPLVELRMPGLTLAQNNLIYGVGGDNGQVELFSYDREKRFFANLGQIFDETISEACYRPHDLCYIGNGRLFVAETDTPTRSSFLWECCP